MSGWDVAVVGAGPAGSSVAAALARRGCSVVLLDRERFPRWKVCGACVSAGALAKLRGLGHGDLARRLGAVGLDRVELWSGGAHAEVRLLGTVALSRAALDGALVERAVRAGVRLRTSVTVGATRLVPGGRALAIRGEDGREGEVVARVVVDASGLGGRFDAEEGARPSVAARGSRIGIGALFEGGSIEVPSGILRMVVGREGYVGLVRLEDGRIDVAAAVDRSALSEAGPGGLVDGLLAGAGLPPLPPEPLAGWRGTPALTRAARSVGAERLFRLGDAGGYVEPFTGEGICWALTGAAALAPLAAWGARRWSPTLSDAWVTWHRGRLERARRLCRLLVPALRRPRWVRGGISVLAVAPFLARPFVRRAGSPPRAPAWSSR